MEEIEFSLWLFEGRLRQDKNMLPDGLNWLCYFAGSSKSHHENSSSFIFLESPHQVDMKNVVKCWKDFLSYFTTQETYRVEYVCLICGSLEGGEVATTIEQRLIEQLRLLMFKAYSLGLLKEDF